MARAHSTTSRRRRTSRPTEKRPPNRAEAATNAEQTDLMRGVLVQFRIAFRAISQHYHRVRKSLGVSGAQLWALAEIDDDRGITVGALSARLAIHQSTASNLVEALESAGLVERRRNSDDGRVVNLYLTGRGTRVMRRAPKPLRGVLQQALCDMPVESVRDLHDTLEDLLGQMHLRGAGARTTTLSDAIDD
jgi:DNA-binding MarR family transcriptional regulator